MEQEREQHNYFWAEFLALATEEIDQLRLDPPAVDDLLDRVFWVDGNKRVN